MPRLQKPSYPRSEREFLERLALISRRELTPDQWRKVVDLPLMIGHNWLTPARKARQFLKNLPSSTRRLRATISELKSIPDEVFRLWPEFRSDAELHPAVIRYLKSLCGRLEVRKNYHGNKRLRSLSFGIGAISRWEMAVALSAWGIGDPAAAKIIGLFESNNALKHSAADIRKLRRRHEKLRIPWGLETLSSLDLAINPPARRR